MKLITALAASAALACACIAAAGAEPPHDQVCKPRFEVWKAHNWLTNPRTVRVVLYRFDRQCRRHQVSSIIQEVSDDKYRRPSMVGLPTKLNPLARLVNQLVERLHTCFWMCRD